MSPNRVQSTESLSAEEKFLRASRNDALAKQGFHPHVDGTTVEKKARGAGGSSQALVALRSRPQVAFTVKEVIAFGCLNGLKHTAGPS